MIRSQRILLSLALLLPAVLMHTTICDWAILEPEAWAVPVVGFEIEHDRPSSWPSQGTRGLFRQATVPPSPKTRTAIGLLDGNHRGSAEQGFGLVVGNGGTDLPFGVTLGIAVPLALVLTFGILWLGWRHADRAARGECPVCRYVLGAAREAGCPECGWNRV